MLIIALRDESWSVRACAAEALGNHGREAEEAAPALIEILKGKDNRAKRPAIDALRKIGPGARDAVPFLKKLGENPGAIGNAARAMLVRMGWK